MKNIVIANWKMALDFKDATHIANMIKKNYESVKNNLDLVLCPSFTAISAIVKVLGASSIRVGAQDCFWEDKGGYTGEISPLDLKNIGCQYVILGHSERRKHLTETNAIIHRKCTMALKNSLIPILCVGENWEERSNKQKDYVLISQITEILEGITLNEENKVIIAYEPVWAISTGEGIEAEPEEVGYAIDVIRHVLVDLFNKDRVVHDFRFIYGGSVGSENINTFLRVANISGVLVGSATQKLNTFIDLLESIDSA